VTSAEWNQAWEIFNEATARQGGLENRKAYVQGLSGIPQHVVDRVLDMIDEDASDMADPRGPQPGDQFGRYTIVELLGRGGMGDVYSARDNELGRMVAMKFLGERARVMPDAMDRLIREAQAASALNHPNLVTVYEVIRSGQSTAIVTELIEGDSLRSMCILPTTVDRVANWGKQIARGLAAAHAQSIVHGDIKPENVIVRSDGLLKILDFGIARRDGVLPQNLEDLTFGTIGYMSPEQTYGKALTGASDVFSLGVVLLELVRGSHPFQERTNAATTLAIRQSDVRIASPEDAKGAGKQFASLLRRMLEKDPAARPSALQVAEELEELLRPKSGISMLWLSLAGAAMLGAAGFVYFSTREEKPLELPPFRPLTSYAGTESFPAFSPDGRQIAFVWSGLEDGNRDVYVKSLDKDDLRRLSTDTWMAFTPVWSPDGKYIAYVRRAPDGSDNRIMIAGTEPGAGERVAAMVVDHQGFIGLAWWPDSTAVIVRDAGAKGRPLVRIDLATGKKRPITHPEDEQDSLPVVSPDGKRLLFARNKTGLRSICVLPLMAAEAQETCTARNRLSYSGAWRDDSATILFREGRSLWEARLDAQNRLGPAVKIADGDFGQLANDFTGKRFAFSRNYSDTNILRIEAGSNRRPVRLFASSEEDSEPEFSPDGSEILFRSARLGHYELYVAARDGSGLRLLTQLGTHVGSARWSPDSQWVVFDGSLLPVSANAKDRFTRYTNIYVISAHGGGAPRRTTDDTAECMVPNWSRDGKWIYFNRERGSHRETWKVAVDEGSTPVRVSDAEMFDIAESPDQRWLYYTKPRLSKGLWRRAAADGAEERIAGTEFLTYRFWQLHGPSSLTFLQGQPNPGFVTLDLTTGKQRSVAPPPKQVPNGPRGMAVSPDGRYILYTEEDLTMGDILMMDLSTPKR